jgi:hypothetical protein
MLWKRLLVCSSTLVVAVSGQRRILQDDTEAPVDGAVDGAGNDTATDAFFPDPVFDNDNGTGTGTADVDPEPSDPEEEERVRTDLVRLIPFDVQIAMTGGAESLQGVNIYALNDIVTDWMTDSFETKSMNQGLLSNTTSFDSIALEFRIPGTRRRALQGMEGDEEVGAVPTTIALYTASFDGVSLWERRGALSTPMDPELVELIQRATFLEGKQLLALLQSADPYTGLGELVVDVRAFITPDRTDQTTVPSSGSDNNLEIIIIIAIVVACLAFGLLMFAVVWAWRTDQTKRDAYKVGGNSIQRPPDGTGSESDYDRDQSSPPQNKNNHNNTNHNNINNNPNNTLTSLNKHEQSMHPPSEIAPQSYPESVISEDISTSLTAYYRSGMAGYSMPKRAGELNDAASMSSMDSYGYSLDGYAPSLSGGPTQMGYPVGPLNGTIKDPEAEDAEGTKGREGAEEEL